MSKNENKQIQALIRRFEAIYDGQPWYGTNILSSLQNIRPEVSVRSLLPEKKNIAEILRHMVAWRQFLIEHLQGNHSYVIELNTALDWPAVDGLSWEELLEEFAASQTTILSLLAEQEDALLKKLLSNGQHQYNFRYLIEGVLQHDAYHLGQINLLGAFFRSQVQAE
ncbi:MAG: DinB family protein [Saprospiraceae bacterium]|nr:DinB family protein [Saprospiraceae bacterium]